MHSIRFRTSRIVPGLLLGAGLASTAAAQVPSALLVEDGPLPGAMGETISSLSNTAVNHNGGYAISVNTTGSGTTLSHVWGNATGGAGAPLATEGTFGDYVQSSFESFYGISDSGAVCYSAISNNTLSGSTSLDGVWVDGTPIAVEEESVVSIPGQFWSFGSRPGITADGTPYWVGGITATQGGSTQNRGLFSGVGQTPLILGGDLLPNTPAPVTTSAAVDFDYRLSANGANSIVPIDIDTTSTTDAVIAVNLAGLLIDGVLVQEGNPVPAAAGGLPGENWSGFDFTGITNGGTYFFTGDTDGPTATDEFILQNGVIIYREGDIVDGFMISGALEGAFQNENADIAYIWDVEDPMLGNVEALFLNGDLILKEGDPVDLDNDGVIDPSAILRDFTGISSLTVSDRAPDGLVRVYFTADIDTDGTTTSTDDTEGFFCLAVQLPECHLVFGTGAGGASFNPGGGHVFTTQVGDIDGSQPVLLSDVGEVVLPQDSIFFAEGAEGQGTVPLPVHGVPGSFSPEATQVFAFTAQVLMWNPEVFPQQPEQFSYPVAVIVRSDGTILSRRYGEGTGMQLWVQPGVNALGQPVIRFPFSIPGF